MLLLGLQRAVRQKPAHRSSQRPELSSNDRDIVGPGGARKIRIALGKREDCREAPTRTSITGQHMIGHHDIGIRYRRS